jgi:hypothetical protein
MDTSRESTFNLFLYVTDSTITSLGVAVHELQGSDEEKTAALQAMVELDFQKATRYELASPVPFVRYEALVRLGQTLAFFEEVLLAIGASAEPLVVITPVLNGKPHFVVKLPVGKMMYRDDLKGTSLEDPGNMVDWLQKYVSDEGFDLPRLMNDDYFLAIKLLFNAKHFVSCNKLLMSFIDTVGFVDAGDVPNNFKLWLDNYTDLTSLGINSEELWEFRSSLLHMSNLSSRKVLAGKVVPLIFFVGDGAHPRVPASSSAKYVNLMELIKVLALGVSKWSETYGKTPGKRADFATRYDLTVSDSRMASFSFDGSFGRNESGQ